MHTTAWSHPGLKLYALTADIRAGAAVLESQASRRAAALQHALSVRGPAQHWTPAVPALWDPAAGGAGLPAAETQVGPSKSGTHARRAVF